MPPPDRLAWIDAELDALAQQGLMRTRRVRSAPQAAQVLIEGQPVVNFGSNDYLGLANDPRVIRAASRGLEQGWGSGASPVVTGYSRWHEQLEQRLAEFEQCAAALVFTSGFTANTGAIAALAGPGDTVYTDRKNHASLLDGCRLSRADVRVFPHNDPDELERLLRRATRTGRRLIVADSLFSMDGDLAPLPALADLAERYDAMLLVDEAHATGVFGTWGRGVAEQQGVERRVDVRIGTLSKALGCVGGFVVGSERLIRWLVNRARPYVFSTASPAANAAAAIAALEIVSAEPERRERLLSRAAGLRQTLAAQGWNTGQSASHIIPVIVGDPQQAVALSARLLARGLYVPAIRPPTVPEGEACLRVSLTAGHTEAMIQSLVDALAKG
jgi:8-amino-7-oxononanoate synthase